MSLRSALGRVPSPGGAVRAAGRRGAQGLKAAARATLERLDGRIPDGVRDRLPEIEVRVGDARYVIRGLHVERQAETAPEPPAPEPEAPPAADAAGFFSSLPRGVRLQHTDPTHRDESLPHTTEEVRALIERMMATLDNLHDVDDFDVVGAVDDDLYRLWREVEKKMQRHRQSEAKKELKGMFNI